MNRTTSWILRLAWVPFLALCASGPARAEVAFDVAVGLHVNDDTRIFLNVTNQTWRPTVPTTVIRQCRYPEDDFPVIAFLAFHSRRSPSFIISLRNDGYAWSEIFFRLNVSPSVLFVGIDRDPGPPYGRAWSYWKKHHRPGAKMRYRISDRDVIGLIKVQTASRHFGVSPLRVIEAHRKGQRAEVFTAHKWRDKHGKKTWNEGHGAPAKGKGKSSPPGKSSGEEKGSSKGKGSGKGSGHGKGGKT
jgi:hypothetical protein